MKRLSFFLIFLLCVGLVSAIPQMTHRFWGDVTHEGNAVSDGNLISVKINGVKYIETCTKDGTYGFDPIFDIPADDTDTSTIEGGVDDDDVDFYVGNTKVVSSVYINAGLTELDLVATSNHVDDSCVDSSNSDSNDGTSASSNDDTSVSNNDGTTSGNSGNNNPGTIKSSSRGVIDYEAGRQGYIPPYPGSPDTVSTDDNLEKEYEKPIVQREYSYPWYVRFGIPVGIIAILGLVVYFVAKKKV